VTEEKKKAKPEIYFYC